MINLAESLSFRHVKGEVKEQFLELFRNEHSPVSAIYSYEDKLHISAENGQKLLEMLADRAINPDYGYIVKLFQEYRDNMLGSRNGSKMFERLAEVIGKYKNLGNGRAIMQEYDKQAGKAFIHCVVTGLMCCVHERIPQAGELCYIDASASFEPLNTSITLLYTSCAAGALLLGVLITSDESELNLLKTILLSYSFYEREPEVGLTVFLTDDSNAERNALNLCWPQAIRLLCTFHILQAFWRWLYDLKHHINKEDRTPIIKIMKKIVYASTELDMNKYYQEFKQEFYHSYPQLQNHLDLLWK
ncbi:unnamed protein product [Rhizophagus irregularis]|uniref:MULE transposase domain-containing protein n=1 Tax=Rhizophagus irregularis TaxID=588596 RepID=A0A915Z7X5_9GLOM|nr:unnamed protein product [Rhizophagus irregularis]